MPPHAGERLSDALPHLRAMEGFPNADDETILRASLPPRYTACPNPFIEGFLGIPREDLPYARGPFAGDVSVGRSDPIYIAQVYHTKVPPKAIAQYIEHFAPDGGIVFDGFCGSGMTGVAARLTGRRAILVDLSPAATAIAAGYCLPIHPVATRKGFGEVLKRLQEDCAWLYRDPDGRETSYVIWSEVYRCPHCDHEAPFSETGFDFDTRRPRKTITCSHCHEDIKPSKLERVLDESGLTREIPVRVKHVGERGDGLPDAADRELVEQLAGRDIPCWYPETWMMGREPSDDGWGDMWRRGYHTGVRRIADFYTKRTLWALAAGLQFARELDAAPEVRHLVQQTVINASINLTKMRRAYQGPLPLVLYFPRMRRECNVIRTLERRFRTTLAAIEQLPRESDVIISTQSSTCLPNIPDNCVDYIFTDPPFGQNIIYSEVNYLWESWMGITTAQRPEAIVSKTQEKGVGEYQELMRQCFAEFRRILKPGRWITVEFHNSKNEVWSAIQEALEGAGFGVEDVRVLDKQQQSFKQASTDNAVQKDLVISARKAKGGQLALRFEEGEEDVWEWVKERLIHRRDAEKRGEPQRTTGNGNSKRDLYGKVVAHWVVNGWRVPMDAAEFYQGLKERFGDGALAAENHDDAGRR